MNKEAIKALVGLTVAEAARKLEAAGLTLSVHEEDGVSIPRTMEFDPNRVNVAVEAGKIIAAHRESDPI
jgi:hypothetical protein